MTTMFKVLPALVLLALPVAAKAAETTTAWTCTTLSDKQGTKVCTSPAIASPTTATAPLKLDACDGSAAVFARSSAASNTSVTIVHGPDLAVSTTTFGFGNAVTTASSTLLAGNRQCVVWGNITPVAGATETTTFKVIQQSGTFRVSTMPSNR